MYNDSEKMPLVSAIIPCYNVEKKIIPCLQSLVKQTYTNLEIIFVDDGSTDSTKDIILDYKESFLQKGMKFNYLYQFNQGPAVAVHNGLKNVNGEYLIWVDPDDWLDLDSIRKRLFFLENNKEYAVVTSNAAIYDSTDLNNPISYLVKTVDEDIKNPDQFELAFYYKSQICSGCNMIRMSAFDYANPSRDICENRAGQNMQMLLPVYYHNKRYFMDEPLYNIVNYFDSLSHSVNNYLKTKKQYEAALEILEYTINLIKMSQEEQDDYIIKGKKYHEHRLFYAAIMYKEKNEAKKQMIIMKQNRDLNLKDVKLYHLNFNPIINALYRIYNYLKKILKKFKNK